MSHIFRNSFYYYTIFVTMKTNGDKCHALALADAFKLLFYFSFEEIQRTEPHTIRGFNLAKRICSPNNRDAKLTAGNRMCASKINFYELIKQTMVLAAIT